MRARLSRRLLLVCDSMWRLSIVVIVLRLASTNATARHPKPDDRLDDNARRPHPCRPFRRDRYRHRLRFWAWRNVGVCHGEDRPWRVQQLRASSLFLVLEMGGGPQGDAPWLSAATARSLPSCALRQKGTLIFACSLLSSSCVLPSRPSAHSARCLPPTLHALPLGRPRGVHPRPLPALQSSPAGAATDTAVRGDIARDPLFRRFEPTLTNGLFPAPPRPFPDVLCFHGVLNGVRHSP